jgi:gliding motility-associated-like protein
MLNRFNCPVSGRATLGILPPDFTISIRRTDCYSNSTSLVSFRICAGNNYEALNKGIPVRFYDRDPAPGGAMELGAGFVTPADVQNACQEYSAIVPTPASGEIWAAVNDTGGTVFPAYIFAETNFANNTSQAPVTPFRVSLQPGDTAVQFGARVQLQADYSGGQLGSFNWQPAQNLSCLQCLDPLATVSSSTRVVFTAQNQHACTASDTTQISVYAEGGVHIPNAFTPNGDGLNDVFYILGSRDIEILKDFSIYDRWGQRIFQLKDVPANDPAYGWQGDSRGTPTPTGAYIYTVLIRFRDGHEQVYKGTVTVIR